MCSDSTILSVPLFITNNYELEVLLSLLTMIFLYKFRSYLHLYYKEMLFLCLIALISFLAPSFQYFCMLLISACLLILSTSTFDFIFPKRSIIAREVFILLNSWGILFYFENVYHNFFFQEKRTFNIQTCIIYLNCIFYVLISKYLFLNRFNLNQFSIYWVFILYLFLVISLCFVYIRILLNTSIIIHTLIPYYLTFGEIPEAENTPSTTTGTTSQANNTYSLLHFSRYYNTSENAEHATRQSIRFKKAGLAVGLFTLGIGSYAAYQQRLQTIAAQESVRIAQESTRLQEIDNREMMRQNDLEEVSQNMRTMESYLKKWGKN
jgi:hypothetical protein